MSNFAKAYSIALGYEGLKEIKGPKDEPKIVEMFNTVGHGYIQDDETAWCAAFVGHCLEKAGIRSTRALNARSYKDWGHKSDLERGAIVVFWRNKKDGWQGHVGFATGYQTETMIEVLGGNQGNSVKKALYPKSQLLGIRKPASMITSRTVGGGTLATVGTVGTAATEAAKQLQPLVGISETLKYAFIALTLVGIGYMLYRRWKDMKTKP